MPIPSTIRVNPLDLQNNIAIGISLPFDKPFSSTYTTQAQLKYNLINLLLTSKGERVMNPLFGTALRSFLFEGIVDSNIESLKASLENDIYTFIPEITVDNIAVVNDSDHNTINLTVYYHLNISQNSDQVTVQFQ